MPLEELTLCPLCLVPWGLARACVEVSRGDGAGASCAWLPHLFTGPVSTVRRSPRTDCPPVSSQVWGDGAGLPEDKEHSVCFICSSALTRNRIPTVTASRKRLWGGWEPREQPLPSKPACSTVTVFIVDPELLVKPWWGGTQGKIGVMECLEMARWCGASRLGGGRRDLTHTAHTTPSACQRWVNKQALRQCGQGGIHTHTTHTRTHTERLNAVSRTPTSANDLVQIEFKGDKWGNRVMDALNLSRNGKKMRNEMRTGKAEKEQKREAMMTAPSCGRGSVPGWRVGWWSPECSRGWP
nr:LOW QUALITY PROTEIN: H19 opposite tumor suppressor [Cavia porcellus]